MMMIRTAATWLLVVLTAFFLGACSEGSTSGSQYAAADLTIETELSQEAASVGEAVRAVCTVTHKTLGVVSVPTGLVTNPAEGIMVDGLNVVPQIAGLFNVSCVVSNLTAVLDTTPVTLVVSSGGAASVDTTVTPEAVTVGQASTVTCAPRNWGGEVTATPTTFTVTPSEGVTIDGDQITTETAGEYMVSCALAEVPAVTDTTPAIWTVGTGEPLTVTATLSTDSIPAGGKADATCAAVDAQGNALEDLEFTLSSQPAEGLVFTDMQVGGSLVGNYDVFCNVVGFAGIDSVPAPLEVVPGVPSAVELFVDPEQAGYPLEQQVTFSWTVTDSQGNEVPDAVVSLLAPAVGVTAINDTTFVLLTEGQHSFTAVVDSPIDVKTTRVLFVDTTVPTIEVTYPTRGLTLTGDSFVKVEGTVLDGISGVASLTINGQLVSLTPEGYFSFSIQSGHGLNVVDIQVSDAAGNQASHEVGYYFADNFINYEETSMEDVIVEDATKVFLGADIIDDQDHDPENVDDLATLIEVVMTEAQVGELLGATLPTTIIPDVIYEELGTPEQPITLTGDIIIEPVFSNTSVSENIYVALDAVENGLMANGSIQIGDNNEPGIELELTLNVILDMEATTAFDLDFITVPAKAILTPTLSTKTYARVTTADFITKYLVGKNTNGPLNITADEFSILLGELEIDPIQDTQIELGSLDFEVIGFTLPVVDLGVVPLDSLFDPIGDLLGGLITPLSNFFDQQVAFIFEPIVKDVAAETLRAALLSLEVDEEIELAAGEGLEPGIMSIKGELDTVSFTPNGGTVTLKAGAWADQAVDFTPLGSIVRGGCSGTDPGAFAFSPEVPMAIALNMDLVNEFLFSGWWNGIFDTLVEEDALNDMGLTNLTDMGVKSIIMAPMLPPIISDCNAKELLRAQLGDAKVEVQWGNPETDAMETVEFFVSLDADIYVSTNADSLSFEVLGLSGYNLDLVSTHDNTPNLEADMEVVLEAFFKAQLESNLLQGLAEFPVPAIDLTGLAGVPDGTALQVGTTETALSEGFLLVEDVD